MTNSSAISPSCRKASKGNRPVCALEDPLVSGSKKKKHFCQSRGRLGMWCSKQEHCNTDTQFCDAVPPRCIKKIKSKTSSWAGRVCTDDFMCKSGRCDTVCVKCDNRNDNGCPKDEFCHVGVCTKQRGHGELCLRDRVCESGTCLHGFCIDCT